MIRTVLEIDRNELREALRRAGERALRQMQAELLDPDGPGSRVPAGRVEAAVPPVVPAPAADMDPSEMDTAEFWIDLDLSELDPESASDFRRG
ncbi:MAG: hypothetical protein KDD11_01485 [Acidobacteria bacterium]|nr:hypothetical protein [Acidobacteriota bacterium]